MQICIFQKNYFHFDFLSVVFWYFFCFVISETGGFQ